MFAWDSSYFSALYGSSTSTTFPGQAHGKTTIYKRVPKNCRRYQKNSGDEKGLKCSPRPDGGINNAAEPIAFVLRHLEEIDPEGKVTEERLKEWNKGLQGAEVDGRKYDLEKLEVIRGREVGSYE